MHGYAGNPDIYPAAVSLVDDADLNPATAAALDVAGQNLADRTAFLNAQRGAVAAENWQAPFNGVTSNKSDCKPSYDVRHGAWLFGNNDGSSLAIRSYSGLVGSKTNGGPGSGQVLGSAVTLAGTVACVLKDPTDDDTYYMSTIKTSDTSGHVYRLKLSTGVYTGILTIPGPGVTDVQLACFDGQFLVATAQGASSVIQTSSDQGSTLVPITGTVPDCDSFWTLAIAPSQILAVANHTITSNEPAVIASFDGVTFSAGTFAATFTGGDSGIGTAWGRDDVGPCWIFCWQHGTNRHFQRSADGSTWTDVGTTLTLGPLWDMVAIDTTFVGVTVDTAAAIGTQIIYSVDGAQTWFLSQFAAINFQIARLWLGAGRAQFALTYDDLAGTSTAFAFSAVIGSAKVPVA